MATGQRKIEDLFVYGIADPLEGIARSISA